MVQQRREQARHRLPEGMGKSGQMERRLDSQSRRQHRAAPGRQVEAADAHFRESESAADRRLLRALHLRLRPPALGARNEGQPGGPPAQPDHRQAHGEDRVGPELGRNSRRRILQAQQGCQLQRLRAGTKGDGRPVRKHLHDVSAAAVRALSQSRLRGQLSVGLNLQARGRRHRADRSGQVPRLAHVRERLPVQEDLLQLEERQGREVHLLLPAHRSRPAYRVLGNLRRPDPLSGRVAV